MLVVRFHAGERGTVGRLKPFQMSHPPTDETLSDRLMYKTIGVAVVTIGHGLYLGFRYLQHGHVNTISAGLLVFLGVFTSVLSLVVFLLKRSEARSPEDRWFVDRG
jgi:hypothetical protein